MTSEKETIKKLSQASVKMSDAKQQEIWNHIEQEIYQTPHEAQQLEMLAPPRNVRRGIHMLKITAAAAAMLAIVGGGIGYEVHHSADVSGGKTPITTASRGHKGLSPIKEYGLVQVPYTSAQISELKGLATAQGITSPYVPTEMGGPSGVYRLLSAKGKNHVLSLNFNDMTVFNANSRKDIVDALSIQGTKVAMEKDFKLYDGSFASWWKITYPHGNFVEILTLKEGGTWVALEPNPAHPLHSFEEGVANYMVPIDKVSISRLQNKSSGQGLGASGTKSKTGSVTAAGITEKTYASSAAAVSAITKIQNASGQFGASGPPVSLGLGIKAQFSGGAGQYSYLWNEGRWTIRTNFWGASGPGTTVVKDMVAYLHTHWLPAPQKKGAIVVTQLGQSNRATNTLNIVAWQVGNHVYELQQKGNPLNALKTVVASTGKTGAKGSKG